MAHRSRRGVHQPRRARRDHRSPRGRESRRHDHPLELHPAAGEPPVPGRVWLRALPADAQLPLGIPAGAGPGASDAMTGRTILSLILVAAAPSFVLAGARSGGLRATLLAARAAVAFEAAGALDSAARYYALARDGGIAAVDPWLRLRLARVTRDTTAAVALLTGLPTPAVRLAPVARARAPLAAGGSAAGPRPPPPA